MSPGAAGRGRDRVPDQLDQPRRAGERLPLAFADDLLGCYDPRLRNAHRRSRLRRPPLGVRRARARGDLTPVVVLTANALEEARRDADRAGVNGFLTKPLKVQELQAVVRNCQAAPHRRLEDAQPTPSSVD